MLLAALKLGCHLAWLAFGQRSVATNVSTLCRIFELMSEYELLLAHPTICSDLESSAHLMDLMKRQPHNVLRYTTAVDILAPAFDTSFFQDTVIATLDNAVYGKPLWVRMLC